MPFLSICLESQASAIACCQFFSLLREIGGNPVILIVDEATSILSDFSSALKISRLRRSCKTLRFRTSATYLIPKEIQLSVNVKKIEGSIALF